MRVLPLLLAMLLAACHSMPGILPPPVASAPGSIIELRSAKALTPVER